MLVTMVLTAMLVTSLSHLNLPLCLVRHFLYLIYAIIVGIGAVLLSFAGVAIGYIRDGI